MVSFSLKVYRVSDDFLDIPLPTYMTAGSAGMDIYAAVKEPLIVEPMSTALVPTNLKIELPLGFEAQIRPRSGLALMNKIILPNSPGTIDSDYRGEIKVIILNLGHEPFVVNRGDRIAQMVISEYRRAEWQVSTTLADTDRGEGGFGSTGTSSGRATTEVTGSKKDEVEDGEK